MDELQYVYDFQFSAALKGCCNTPAALAAINRKTPPGACDHALLSVLLQTGQRVSEVPSLRWRHVTIERKTQLVTLEFEQCKGGNRCGTSFPPL
ncbi:tyrosine-type recombinase/integrase [Ktedonobacter racemifer]|uniref:tyrosine-type recombinase/integrase n=1 Tax=Ktedonobacter racemifer TaxID=363277 RepID=UPI00094911D8